MLSIYERLNTDYIDRIKQDIYDKYRPLISRDARETRQLALAEQARLDSLDHTGMTLDQLKAEHHVVSQRLARGIYRDDTKADLEERQDKLLLSIKRKERHA